VDGDRKETSPAGGKEMSDPDTNPTAIIAKVGAASVTVIGAGARATSAAGVIAAVGGAVGVVFAGVGLCQAFRAYARAKEAEELQGTTGAGEPVAGTPRQLQKGETR
jgi:hypothetical protein